MTKKPKKPVRPTRKQCDEEAVKAKKLTLDITQSIGYRGLHFRSLEGLVSEFAESQGVDVGDVKFHGRVSTRRKETPTEAGKRLYNQAVAKHRQEMLEYSNAMREWRSERTKGAKQDKSCQCDCCCCKDRN